MIAIINKQKESAHLSDQLQKSLAIRTLWPDAFANGCTCKPVTVLGMAPYPHTHKIIKRVHLERSDGEQYPLTIDQYISVFGDIDQEKANKGFKI